MKIYWEDLGSHIVNIKDNDNWHLFCELDEYEDAIINLDLNGRTHQLCRSDEYTQDKEHLGLTSYHVLDFYSAVVKSISNRIKSNTDAYLDIAEIKNEVIVPFWHSWKEAGLLTEDLC